jgi:medium-chain acyl-[acyl-carrier-protein] hydrolase
MTKLVTMRSRWIVSRSDAPTNGARFYCFPFAGGGASLYRPWMLEPHPYIHVCSISLPGREGRIHEEPYRRMSMIADAVAAELMDAPPVPFAFFGYSMGATLSFEVARRMDTQGRGPRLLVVAASRPPQLARRPDRSDTYNLPDEALIQTLKELQGTASEVLMSPETMEIVLPRIRADLEAVETYRYAPGKPLDCPLVALGGSDDPRVSLQDLERWREQTTSSFLLHILQGNHFFLLQSWPLVKKLVFPHLIEYLAFTPKR